MTKITRDQVLAHIERLSLLETKAMIDALKERLGVDDTPAYMPVPSPDQGDAPSGCDQTEFAVVLTDVGASRISVIREVRQISGLGLKESKDLAEDTPAVIREGLSKDDAEAMKAQLEAAGGTVELK